MSFRMNDLPGTMTGLPHLVRAKTLDLVNSSEEEATEKDTLFNQSRTEAEKWYDTASEEEKEELRKRFPEDIDRVD